MTINEISLNRPKVFPIFCVISLILQVETLPYRREILRWDSLSSRWIPVSEWVLGIRSVFLIILLNHLPQEIQILFFRIQSSGIYFLMHPTFPILQYQLSEYLLPKFSRTVRCSLYTPRRVHGSCHCLDAKLPEKIWEVCKTTNRGWVLVNLTIAETLSHLNTNHLLLVEVEDRDIVDVITDPTILCVATLESADLAIYGPKMKDSTTLKMMRNTLASWNWSTLSVFFELLDLVCYLVVSLLYWNVTYSFTLSSLKANKRIGWWFVIRSLIQWSCLFIGINASLGIPRHSANGPISKCICRVSVLLFGIHGFVMILLPWVVTTLNPLDWITVVR